MLSCSWRPCSSQEERTSGRFTRRLTRRKDSPLGLLARATAQPPSQLGNSGMQEAAGARPALCQQLLPESDTSPGRKRVMTPSLKTQKQLPLFFATKQRVSGGHGRHGGLERVKQKRKARPTGASRPDRPGRLEGFAPGINPNDQLAPLTQTSTCSLARILALLVCEHRRTH